MTTGDEDHVPTPADEGHGKSVWFLFLAGPTIWFTYFILVYALAEVLCKPLAGDAGAAGLPLISIITVVATVVAALLAAAAAVVAYRRWQATRTAPDASAEDQERASMGGNALVLSGFLLSVLFTIAVVLTGAPALVLRPC